MDLFLINGQDGPSLAEMVDFDIKSVSGDALGIGNYFSLGYDLPSLDFDDTDHWPLSYTANSTSSFELDFFSDTSSSLMVNPNSIMPFVSTNRTIKKQVKEDVEIKEETVSEESQSNVKKFHSPSASLDVKPNIVEINNPVNFTSEIPVQTPTKLDFVPAAHTKKDVPLTNFEYVDINSISNTSTQVHQLKRQVTNKRHNLKMNNDELCKEYPKPAYSYSCLIAMALKNSRSGSLPVSEIYSFMCDHFPYFKTAPNGWKNSVRHNLSLNKCFEKIEKPQAPGSCGTQRKGCLWAMNPAKIAKMDDEVAKWSRKDPSAIKKAMVNPENLELLERGEMKIGSLALDEDCETEIESDARYSGDESEQDEDDVLSTIDDESEDEISRVPPSLQPFDSRITQFLHISSSTDNLSVNSLNTQVEADLYEDLKDSDTSRRSLGLETSVPNYDSDSDVESLTIPVQKRPRIQGNYLYKTVSHINKHSLNGFRISVENQ
uniref:Fork-head domain-containing protein n=1 Tax=Clastoptera arizonana TaxID=38151 RepID=A0A1B6CS16_9HEMI